ncbi:hypothetical protein C8R43DRAFT_1132277 [Mycena crocata]|nr:hypothetical protein C8R43DRAFT_1132277 [Mycena crocata]
MSNRSPQLSFLQGSAMSALTWVLYDAGLTLDREIISVWRSSWSLSKVLFLFSRYHTIIALGFFLMEASGLLKRRFGALLKRRQLGQSTLRYRSVSTIIMFLWVLVGMRRVSQTLNKGTSIREVVH